MILPSQCLAQPQTQNHHSGSPCGVAPWACCLSCVSWGLPFLDCFSFLVLSRLPLHTHTHFPESSNLSVPPSTVSPYNILQGNLFSSLSYWERGPTPSSFRLGKGILFYEFVSIYSFNWIPTLPWVPQLLCRTLWDTPK